MKTTLRTFGVLGAVLGLTQLAACAYQQPYGQPTYAAPGQTVYQPAYQGAPGCQQSALSDPIISSVIGGGLGGLLGSQFGKGQGNAVMTALGAVGGVVAAQHLTAGAAPCN
ncbi:MAG TPA: hypothetical protein VFQ88_13520 [Nevskiaceae bacterium]|nr:hypothetical protein [Nevskiaceae bacterium]